MKPNNKAPTVRKGALPNPRCTPGVAPPRSRAGFCVAALAVAALLTACQDRRIFITSEPTGARVILNDAEVGTTPCEVNFTYFGTYDVRLRKDGYEPLVTKAEAKAPPHEWPGVDLAAMAVPVEKTTRIQWHFKMEPEVVDDQALLSRAAEMHTKAAGPGSAPPTPSER